MDNILSSLNFPARFSGWIRASVSTPANSISLNVDVWGFFRSCKVDRVIHLSPLLFVMCTDYLSRLIKVRTMELNFKFHPKCGMHNNTHLAFADDLIVMARGDHPSVKILAAILQKFGEISGLKANNLKESSLFLAGVRGIETAAIEDDHHFTKGSLPVRYLGIPLSASRLQCLDYSRFIEQIP